MRAEFNKLLTISGHNNRITNKVADMPVTFAGNEAKLIGLLCKEPKETMELERARELLIEHMGDMAFNARIREKIKELEKQKDEIKTLQEKIKELKNKKGDEKEIEALQKKITEFKSQIAKIEIFRDLATFTYKTIDFNRVQGLVKRLNFAIEVTTENVDLVNFQKLTLADMGLLQKVASLSDLGILEDLKQDSKNTAFNAVSKLINDSETTLERFSDKAVKESQYRSGDLLFYDSSKTALVKGRQQWLGHEGKLEEVFISKFNHAASITVGSNGKPMTSDIWSEQVADLLDLDGMLQGLSFRIDPTKLVPSKEMRDKLERSDFGYEDGKKISWEEWVHREYEHLATDLHFGFAQVRLEYLAIELKENNKKTTSAQSQLDSLRAAIKTKGKVLEDLPAEIEAKKKKIDEIENKIHLIDIPETQKRTALDTKMLLEQEVKELSIFIESDLQLNKQIKEFATAKQKLLKDIKLEKSKVQEIKQDFDRLEGIRGWIFDSHTTSTKVDFGELAHQMFNASPEKKEMICSEFVASCVGSIIDRLNRSLQGYLPGEKTIIRNPISDKENFYRLNPERLFLILNKAGCITPVRNTFLDAIVDTKSTKKSASIDLHAVVLLDIASIFDKAQDKDEFVDKAQNIMSAYLKASDIEMPNSQEVKGLFEACYDEGKKEPSKKLNAFKALFVKVLRFLHVKSQKTETKATIAAKLEEIERASRISHLAKTKSAQVTTTPGSKQVPPLGDSQRSL